MSAKTIILAITNGYPFGKCEEYNRPNILIQVKEEVECLKSNQTSIKQKICALKLLKFHHLIRLEACLQEEKKYNLLFQYIPIKLQTWIQNISDQFFHNTKNQLLSLAYYLSLHNIIHNFRIQNLGMDDKCQLKYYLGFDFIINKLITQEKIYDKNKQQIQNIFNEAGPIKNKRKVQQSSHKIASEKYHETMDTCKNTIQISPVVYGKSNLKKTKTAQYEPIQFFEKREDRKLKIYTQFDQICIDKMQKSGYNHQKNEEIKIVKIEELGQRINKLKHIMKEITGKTPTNSTGLSHITVKIDQNNRNNKIYQQSKFMITPSYTQLQKNISEYRQSKLLRAYNQKEILFSRNNQGYQVNTIQKLQSPRGSSKLPHYLKKNSNPIKKSVEIKNTNLNSSKNLIKQDEKKEKEYLMMASADKYCQEFLFFLEEGQATPLSSGGDSTFSLQRRQEENCFSSVENLVNSKRLQIKNEEQSKKKETDKSIQIQNRVKNAIRNSMKLMSDLKIKDSTNG